MDILFTSFNQEAKGSFLRAFAFAKELAKRGHKVTLLCASTNSTFEDKTIENVRLICFPWGKRFLHGYNPCEVRARKRWLGKQRFDIVHTFDMRPTCAKPAFQAQRNGAVMFTDWADWFGKGGSVEQRSNPFVRALLRPIESYAEQNLRVKADASTTICSQLFKMAQDIGIPNENLLLLPNGFDQEIKPVVSKADARQALNLAINAKIVASLGAFFAKDFVLLKDAIDLYQSEADLQFLHIGQGNANLNDGTLKLTGYVSDEELSLYLQACDILLLPMADLPANHGRFPLKFSEYISAGRPVLATRVGDIPDFITAHQCGYVCDPNPKAFAQILKQAFSNPKSLNQKAQNAKELSQKPGFRWQDRAMELEIFYKQLLTAKTN